MNEEKINQLFEDKINCLRKIIDAAQNVIPAHRCNLYAELDSICFEIIEYFGNSITRLQEFNLNVQMDSLKRAKGVEKILQEYIIFGNQVIATKTTPKCKLFISHSTEDAEYVAKLVQLFEYLGFGKETMFCSSYAGYGIPLDEDIYDYLKKQFNEYELHIILVLSNNYYQSPASLNEMGAAWVLSRKQTAILLPGFDFEEIKGAINPNKISIKMDQKDQIDLKYKIGELRDRLLLEFGLCNLNVGQWERKRDEFIDGVQILSSIKKKSVDRKKLIIRKKQFK